MEAHGHAPGRKAFPYFFVGTFIEALLCRGAVLPSCLFPYFFVGTFIEAAWALPCIFGWMLFPYFFVGTFIEAAKDTGEDTPCDIISLLFRRDFH